LVRRLLRSPPGDRAAHEGQGDGRRLSRIQTRRCVSRTQLLLREGQQLRLLRGWARRDVDGEARQRAARGLAQVERRAPDIRRGVQSPGHAR
jgi:hypothetical protein